MDTSAFWESCYREFSRIFISTGHVVLGKLRENSLFDGRLDLLDLFGGQAGVIGALVGCYRMPCFFANASAASLAAGSVRSQH